MIQAQLIIINKPCQSQLLHLQYIYNIYRHKQGTAHANKVSGTIATWKGSADESLTSLSGYNSTQQDHTGNEKLHLSRQPNIHGDYQLEKNGLQCKSYMQPAIHSYTECCSRSASSPNSDIPSFHCLLHILQLCSSESWTMHV